MVNLLRQIEVSVTNGKTTALACKGAGIVEQTYFRWRKEYGYEQGAAATDPILGYVSFYRDGAKVFETKPEALTPVAGSRLGMVPLNFTVVPSGLKPGEYQCQVTVLDPTRGRATYWQAPIVLVP